MAAGSLDVLIRFVGDSSKLQAETAKVQGTGAKIKTWAKGIGAAIGIAFAVDKIRDFVNAGAELQDQISASQVIFGQAAGAVEKFASSSATAFGISKSAALDAANNFAAFGKGAGLTGKQLAGFSTDLVGLAGDLASFRGTSTEQAIEAIGAALRGETEPIRAYGVLLDDASLRQEALAKGLIATTKQALTPQQKVLAAQSLLFKQTSDAQGDYARTSDSAANQQKTLNAQMENASAAIGTALLPVVQQLLPLLQTAAQFFADNAGILVPLTATILAIVAAVKLWAIAQGVLNVVLTANPIGLIVIGIAALIAGIVLLVKNWDKVTAAFKAAFGWLKQNWPLLLAILTGPIGAAVALIVKNWDTVKAGASAVISWLRTAWSALTNILTAPFRAAWSVISGIFGQIRNAAAAVWNFVSGIVSSITGAVLGAVHTVGGVGSRIAEAIKGPINAVIRAWNRLGIPGFTFKQELPGPLPDISFHWGGIDLPNIPELARGGYVMRTGLALVHEGEAFSGTGGNFGNTYNLHVTVGPGTDPAQTGRTIVDYIGAFERANGRKVLLT
ncbi:MAG TPA: hypothetical protein VKB59_22730 [Micromonosporaceae bacterium]|nr:hypothetical protein [Micromonosporaceae bacterium]